MRSLTPRAEGGYIGGVGLRYFQSVCAWGRGTVGRTPRWQHSDHAGSGWILRTRAPRLDRKQRPAAPTWKAYRLEDPSLGRALV